MSHFRHSSESSLPYLSVLRLLKDRSLSVSLLRSARGLSGHIQTRIQTRSANFWQIFLNFFESQIAQKIHSGLVVFAIIPQGSTGIEITVDDGGIQDDIQLFTRTGQHIAGTNLSNWSAGLGRKVTPADFMTTDNGFLSSNYSSTFLNGTGNNIKWDGDSPPHNILYSGMNITYTGDDLVWPIIQEQKLTIDTVNEDLILMVVGQGGFSITANWTTMGTGGGGTGGTTPGTPAITPAGDLISIKTQDLAQKALERIDDAIVKKDNVRAHLGALQNRFENTVTNLAVQAENLQASESRISDTDVAAEMTELVRNQILTQSATAMLAQANSLSKMLAQLIRG